eukprot:7153686-Heterocapsa_arctica.AAC.1
MAMGRVRRDLGLRQRPGESDRLSYAYRGAERQEREGCPYTLGRKRLWGLLCESGEEERKQDAKR